MLRTFPFRRLLPILLLSFGKLPDGRRHIRLRRNLCHQLLDLTFGLVGCSSQKLFAIAVCEMRCQHREAAQVKTSIVEHLKKRGMST
ncbi:MAG: hypothetical protein E2P02_22090 [Acidobacteria bacterium]|nr:MAG: hypothetical protein E2P02_22090 [Acidobacteriota bacterium]